MIFPEVTARIRAILLHPEPRITIDVAAQLLNVSRAHIDKAIRERDVEAIDTCAGRRIDLVRSRLNVANEFLATVTAAVEQVSELQAIN